MASTPYEDAPLMLLTGVCGAVFLALGLRAAFAERRAKRPARPERTYVADPEGWDTTITVRRDR